MRIAIASDHAAVELRLTIAAHLQAAGHAVHDLGCAAGERVDYPQYAAAVARRVVAGESDRGVLVCGTGIGMSIAANKIDGVRAALAHDVTTATLAARHNDANVLCLGGRIIGAVVALDCVDAWLSNPFEPRHQPRLDAIAALQRGE